MAEPNEGIVIARIARAWGIKGEVFADLLTDFPERFDDVARLLQVLGRLVESGNTVVVIEHNLDVIKTADWVIDLGPEGGDKGGELVAAGTPEQVARNGASYTGRYLRPVLGMAGIPAESPGPRRRRREPVAAAS